jgi:alpha-N-arabinofuranosidase
MKTIIAFALCYAAFPLRAAPEATITVRADQRLGRVSPMLYGQFIEHLGSCIDGGLFEPGSALSDTNGFRRDVLEKARELRPRILRWPGGTYTKIYHWQDGVGPLAERRCRPNLIWGGEESHRFGTDEFVRYCRALGAEPYISVNMGTGTPEEAANWVEYCNGTGTTYYAELRRKHGSPDPYGVKYWGLGNEEEAEPDCGRLQDPKEYARVAWQFAKLMKLQDPSIRLIVAGVGNSTNWNQTVLGSLHPVADYLSAHWYFRTHDYARLLGSVAAFDRQLGEYARFLDTFPAEPTGFSHWYRFPPRQGPVKLAIDEWGLWNGGAGGREVLWNLNQTYTWQDALAVASWLNAMHRHAEVIGFATWAQLVNIIAPIQAGPAGSVRQTVFHPLALYARACGDVSVEAACESPALEGGALPALDVAATRRESDGTLILTVVNRDAARAVTARIGIDGGAYALRDGEELSADTLSATNALARLADECVHERRLSALSAPDGHTFPARSVTRLTFRGAAAAAGGKP